MILWKFVKRGQNFLSLQMMPNCLIKNIKDVNNLQTDLEHFDRWIKDWSLTLNIKKCQVVSFGRRTSLKINKYFIDNVEIERTELITDLGVTFDPQLKFSTHINEKINKAYARLGVIRRNFNCMSPDIFCLLYKSIVRSHLEYASSCMESPFKRGYRSFRKGPKAGN